MKKIINPWLNRPGYKFCLLLVLFLTGTLSAQSNHFDPVNPNTNATTRALLERMYRTVDEGKIMSGLHHNQLQMPNYVRDLNRIDEAVPGAVPMVWGGDLAWDADQVVQMSIDHHRQGYLISMTWHAARPFDHGHVKFREQTQGRFTRQQWAELVTEGSEMHRQWIAQVDSIAQYLKVLQDNDVPVLWRPFHEMNGEWFWWGDRRGAQGFIVLWKMLYHRLTDYHHLNNLLWVWNPNNPRKHPVDNKMGYELYYPGDEYVDVLAADVYHREWFQDTHDQLHTLGHGKMLALGEVGELPTAEQLASYNRYAWFMIWTDFTTDKYNTLDALRDIFSNERVLNLNSLKGKNILFVYGGWDGHEPKQCHDLLKPWMLAEGANVISSDNLDVYTNDSLMQSIDLIVQCWTMGSITPEQERGLLKAVRNGKGIAGWHGGTADSFRNNTEYQFMIGGQWVAHPGGVTDYNVQISPRLDYVTQGLQDFHMHSEQYYMHVDPNVEVLATTTFTGNAAAPWIAEHTMPVVWKTYYGQGKVFYSSLGHVARDFEVPEMLEIMKRGIRWAAN